MTKYIDPKLSQESLETYQGYSLQVFTSGRIKLSFHKSHKDRVEYYAVKPKRSREAYKRQYDCSAFTKPEHYQLIEMLLAEHPNSLIYRVHLTKYALIKAVNLRWMPTRYQNNLQRQAFWNNHFVLRFFNKLKREKTNELHSCKRIHTI